MVDMFGFIFSHQCHSSIITHATHLLGFLCLNANEGKSTIKMVSFEILVQVELYQ